MPVSAHFLEQLRETLAFVPELSVKRMFGAAGVYSGELMFAAVFDDVLYLKADAETEGAFKALGLEPARYRTAARGELKMSYWQAPEAVWEEEAVAREWTGQAIEAALRKARPNIAG